jgi:hypothetical protein
MSEIDPPAGEARLSPSDADPYDGEAEPAPPLAGPELGGGSRAAWAEDDAADPLDRAADALLRLAGERPWRDITLRDVAEAAQVPFARLYARAPGKTALLGRLSARLDRSALEAAAADAQPAARDRLFEAFMARLEAMEPHRDALLAIARAAGPALAPRLPLTVRGLLEAAGVDTSGGRGALRIAAFTAVWARTLQVWRDDEGALNRTMAEIDRLIARADRRLSRLGAGL